MRSLRLCHGAGEAERTPGSNIPGEHGRYKSGHRYPGQSFSLSNLVVPFTGYCNAKIAHPGSATSPRRWMSHLS
jgi:hypothetical protein